MAETEVRYEEPVLCYINDRSRYLQAWFTTRQLDKQWGDAWDEAPWLLLAGEPYEFSEHDKHNGIEPWKIVCVAFVHGGVPGEEVELPGEYEPNSLYSVRDINQGAVSWLEPGYSEHTPIPAGTTLSEFKRIIEQHGGEIYAKEEQ